MKILNINFSIETLEDIHLGNGLNCPGLYDDGFTKDHNGDPIFNFDTFKGLLRQSAHEIIHQKPEFKSEYSNLFFYKNQQSLDILISYNKKDDEYPFIIHTFTRIDRNTRKSTDKSLRSIECLKKGCSFNGEIRYLANDSVDLNKISDLLIESLLNLQRVGGSRTRGIGKISISNIVHRIDEYSFDEATLSESSANSISLILQLKDNVTIADGALLNNNHYRTLDYFSGTSVLGMLRVHLAKTDQDLSMLNDSRIMVSNFLPIPFDCINYFKDQNQNPDIIPIPFTARKKKKDGFKDQPIPHWALKSLGNKIDKDEFINDKNNNESNKSFSGGYLINKNGDMSYYSVPVTIQMRNKIDSSTQAVSDQSLFTEEKVLKNNYFQGTVTFQNNEDLHTFLRLMKPWLDKNVWLHLGRGSKPVEIFDYYFTEISQDSVIDKDIFILTLQSDAILLEENGSFASIIKPGYFAKEIHLTEDQKIVLKRHNSETRIIHSFHGLSGTRRFGVKAIKAGSVFEYKLINLSPEDRANLKQLLDKGIGLRKNEGFGKVRINHPVHSINNQNQNSDNPEIYIPRQDDFCLKMSQKHDCKKSYSDQLKAMKTLKRWKRILRYTLTFVEAGTPLNIIYDLLKEKKVKVKDHNLLFDLLNKMLTNISNYEILGFILREVLKGEDNE